MARNKLLISSCLLVLGVGLASCETVGDVVGSGMRATMTGAEEVPARGDPDAVGTAEVSVVDRTDNLCYRLDVHNVGTPTAAHIHRGARGVAGPPVVMLDPPADGESHGCLSVPSALVDEIEANPGGFYVNVHNAQYPNGALRGQLTR
jgi:hypothetical protein